MIFWLSSLCWALDCGIDKELVTAGTLEAGFVTIFDHNLTQHRPVWNDEVLRMMMWVENYESELLSTRWESDQQGLLYEYTDSKYSQLWFSNLDVGTHKITATVTNRAGDVCQQSLAVKVQPPPFRCAFFEPSGKKSTALVNKDFTANKIVQYRNKFPFERILYPVVETRAPEDLRSWIAEEGKKDIDISFDMNGEGRIVLPPRFGSHYVTLFVETPEGKQCSSLLKIVQEPTTTKAQVVIDKKDRSPFSDLLISSSFGIGYHTGWGGDAVVSPAFDLVALGRSNDFGYMIGGDVGIDFRESYRTYMLKFRLGVLNGLSYGPIAFATGGGVGYDEFVQQNSDLTEEHLYESNHMYTYWRSDIFVFFQSNVGISGGLIPRWHFDPLVESEHFFDSMSWHSGLHFGLFLLRYQQHYVLDKQIHSVMIGLGNNLFQGLE